MDQTNFIVGSSEFMDQLMRMFYETSPYEGFDPCLHPDDMQGWGSSDPIFEEVIRAVKPKIVVEVGSWKELRPFIWRR
jgi:hypothetical protein